MTRVLLLVPAKSPRRSLRDALAARGLNVDTMSDVERAMELLEAGRSDGLIIDATAASTWDPIEVVDQVRDLERSSAIIVMAVAPTGSDMIMALQQRRVICLRAGEQSDDRLANSVRAFMRRTMTEDETVSMTAEDAANDPVTGASAVQRAGTNTGLPLHLRFAAANDLVCIVSSDGRLH